ncbi:MAG: glutamate-5-semialdehyde dehydrogenase [Kiritimatiellia bacterium]
MSLHEEMLTMGDRAVAVSRLLAKLGVENKNAILRAMAAELRRRRPAIQAANAVDMKGGRAAGLSEALLDRLLLSDSRVEAMARSLEEIAVLPDPVGGTIAAWTRPNGLEIRKVRVPIGVIAIIYESRPNVTADAAALCFKSSNAVILRGGKEAIHSNGAIAEALREGGAAAGMPRDAIQLVATADREAVRELVQMTGRVDLAIPRGGESLIRAVVEQARVPVIKHYKGVCHVYVDAAADLDAAARIVENAKCQRPGVCNSMECLLVHEAAAPAFVPRLAARFASLGCELRGDEAARKLSALIQPAAEEDWYREYLALVMNVKVVRSTQDAIAHINHYGSHHSDAIVTADETAARAFTQEVDSAAVYVNASTRFTDGGEFGMGAEMGISTDKLHARGPMGLEELTTYKFVVLGTGQVRG